MPVDHPLVPLAHGGGLDRARVRAGVLGLGHGEARLHGPLDQGEEPLLLLLSVPYLARIVWLPELGATTPKSEAAPTA